MFEEQYIIVDIETYTPSGSPDPEKDEIRYVGFSIKGNKKIYHISEYEQIQKCISWAHYIVGHNVLLYDKPILMRHGFQFPYSQIVIDTYTISENRLKQMMYLDLNAGDKSLRSLLERFNLSIKKGIFDYSLLKKERLEGEEYDSLVEYLYADLDGADELFKFYYTFFYGFREYMSEENKRKMCWLTSTAGSTAYKSICNMAGLPEEYEDSSETKKNYDGAYVTTPIIDYAEGNIYLFDFRSLYPHMMMGFNLYSKVKENWYRGSPVYPDFFGNEEDGFRGHYKIGEMGKVESCIYNLLKTRLEIDHNLTNPLNTKEENTNLKRKKLAIKILINTMYGILGSKQFKSVYNLTSASDCTALARRTIKNARSIFESNGYECLYTDTDSIYVVDPFRNRSALETLAESIAEYQKINFNIPIDTHALILETKIKRIWFFRNDKGEFIKKHYVYITEENELVVKGIKIKQGNCSKLALAFFNESIKAKFIDNTFEFYTPEKLLEEIKSFLVGREDLLLKRYRVDATESYKVGEQGEEPTSIQYQISKKYGGGEHWLVINKRIGPGKVNHYAPMEVLKEKYSEHWLDQVCLEEYMKDLSEFIKAEDRNKISKQDRKRVVYEAEKNRPESVD